MSTTTLSQAIYDEMCTVIPGGVNSPVRNNRGLLSCPIVAAKAQGATLTDADGKTYIDFCLSWGAIIHGHAHSEILERTWQRMQLGTTFGVTTAIEGELAKKVVSIVPGVEKLRFVCSGTEACMTVIRLARGFTGRDLIVKFAGCYHGHSDAFLVQAGSALLGSNATSSSAGVPEASVANSVCLPYNDEAAFAAFMRERGHELAAVILEPVAGNMGVVQASQAFMNLLREKTAESGALLIFDEVITGFRIARIGAQAYYDVKPDLFCFGKVMGGGFPVAAFGGRADIMDRLAPLGPVYQAGTLAGNPVAMEAGLAALEMLDSEAFYKELERKAKLFCDPVQAYIEQRGLNACVQRVGSIFTLFFGKRSVQNADDAKAIDKDRFGEYFRRLLSEGIYFPASAVEAAFVSAAHTDSDMQHLKEVTIDFLKDVPA